jgi:hypothetical protein
MLRSHLEQNVYALQESGFSEGAFPYVEELLELKENKEALLRVAMFKKISKYVNFIDFLFCEIYLEFRKDCYKYYEGGGGQLADLADTEVLQYYEDVLVNAIHIASKTLVKNWTKFRIEVLSAPVGENIEGKISKNINERMARISQVQEILDSIRLVDGPRDCYESQETVKLRWRFGLRTSKLMSDFASMLDAKILLSTQGSHNRNIDCEELWSRKDPSDWELFGKDLNSGDVLSVHLFCWGEDGLLNAESIIEKFNTGPFIDKCPVAECFGSSPCLVSWAYDQGSRLRRLTYSCGQYHTWSAYEI